jgi:hypothetical protein
MFDIAVTEYTNRMSTIIDDYANNNTKIIDALMELGIRNASDYAPNDIWFLIIHLRLEPLIMIDPFEGYTLGFSNAFRQIWSDHKAKMKTPFHQIIIFEHSKKMEDVFREIIEHVYHPKRIEQWLLAGNDIETYMM